MWRNPVPTGGIKKTTGLFGGVSIFVSMTAAWLIAAGIFFSYSQVVQPLLPLTLGGAAMFLLGLVDDIWEVNPQYKLIGQVVVAAVLVFFRISVFPGLHPKQPIF